jgi:hypothetical protein
MKRIDYFLEQKGEDMYGMELAAGSGIHSYPYDFGHCDVLDRFGSSNKKTFVRCKNIRRSKAAAGASAAAQRAKP